MLRIENENELTKWIIEGGIVGAPKSRNEVKYAAWGLSSNKSGGITGDFPVTGPSDGWISKYLARNPDIIKRKAETLS